MRQTLRSPKDHRQRLEEQGLGKCGQRKDVSGAHGEDAADAET